MLIIIILFYIYFSNKKLFFINFFQFQSFAKLHSFKKTLPLKLNYQFLKIKIFQQYLFMVSDAGIKVAKIIKGIKYQSLVGFIDDDINLKNRIINNTQCLIIKI